MLPKVSVTCEQLDRAIRVIEQTDRYAEPEFKAAGQKTVTYLTKDLKGGVASLSGDLRSSIGGEVKQVVGANVEFLMSANPSHGGYNYAARLDKDRRPAWRAGRFKGRRTWGWFTYVLKRIAPRAVKRYARDAVKNLAARLAREIG